MGFTAFSKRGVRFIGAPKSILTKPFNPAEFLGLGGENWEFWRGPADDYGLIGEEDRDERSFAIVEINPTRIICETHLKKGENLIAGEEKLRRSKETEIIRLGGNAFLGLWLDYQAKKENSVLEWLYRTREITYLNFFGDILRGPGVRRYVLCFYRLDDGKWYWSCHPLDLDWYAVHLSAGYPSIL